MILWTLLLLGCGDPVPRVEIVEPQDGAVVCGAPLVVRVAVEDFELVPLAAGTDPPDGAGHVDVFVNGQSAAMGGETVFRIALEDGEIQLRAELVNANHTSLDPYAGDTIYVTVDAASCP